MFILKRQDVEISTMPHPKRDQQVPVLYYQGQTFRLISVFKASQEEEAKALWRDLTDHRGKACVLLEEPERYSVWGKIRAETQPSDTSDHNRAAILTLASILILQAVYIDIEDLLGTRQAASFEKGMVEVFKKSQFPLISSAEAVKYLLTTNAMKAGNLPSWQENHVLTLLSELHRLGKEFFGNNNFALSLGDRLQDMSEAERSLFLGWLKESSLSKLWH
jgi:hypothetical protein